ncbi:replication initiator protein [Blackfly microvirus SF02]|uniref:Replication initiator protein n=1 Tax=Blackfly microvirus SF02 TaxID=2576452 RepID=A0A4P8PKL2_9VIRU|nr:replication initiator protein [Blackfly microvirus SF02]
MQAWRPTPTAKPTIGSPPIDKETLLLPCGKCQGCRSSKAREWAFRCYLEAMQHKEMCWSTLTYAPKYLPPTLVKAHIQKFKRRLRKLTKKLYPNRDVRTFECGEYGEKFGRPHYHIILFGLSTLDKDLIEKAWRSRNRKTKKYESIGNVQTYDLGPAAIAYVAGYTQKKLTDTLHQRHERVDPDTGEAYYWQPPFINMSRRPGIGGKARKYENSWKEYAVYNGTKIPVPRFLHEAWKKSATEEQIQTLAETKKEKAQLQALTLDMLYNRELNALTKKANTASTREL